MGANKMRKYIGIVVVLMVMGFWLPLCYAISVSVDTFSITRDGSLVLNDTFSDGIPPPSGPLGATTYAVNGTIPASAESGGLLLIDSANGVLSENAVEAARRTLTVTRLTSTSGGASQLSNTDTLLLKGIFGLVIPTGPLANGYGVRFTDNPGGAGNTHQILQMQVSFNATTNTPQIRYLLQDFDLNTVTTLGSASISAPAGDDEICLYISRPDTSNDNFFGSYAYGTAGVCGPQVQFLTPGLGFQGEDFVRGQFFAFQAVPEPNAAILLLCAGAILLPIIRLRRKEARPA